MLKVQLTGSLKTCDGCARDKAQAARIPKTTEVKVRKPGEHLFVDTSGPFSPTVAGSHYWIKMGDDYSHYSWRFFCKSEG